jgi:glycosyltransferase involved in cell wall biosynthesis
VKILYLHQYFKTPTMSGGTRSYEMARRMAAAGHEVHMVTTRQGRDRGWAVEEVDGITVHWLNLAYDNRMSYLRRILAFLAFAARSSIRAVRVGGDVVFATSTPLTIAIPGVLASKLRGAPMVFEVRDLWPELPIAMGALKNPITQWLARRLERFAYQNSAAVIALSPGMADGVVATGYPAKRVVVVPNSCDSDAFAVSEEAGGAIRRGRPWLGERSLVIYAGTLGAINGVSYLVDLARETRTLDPDVRFLVVGAGAEQEKIRWQAARDGVLGQNFFMESPLPKKDMPALFSAAAICTSLFLPIREMEANSANKFFDTIAAGRPIAINHGGWLAESIESNDLGLVLPSNDPASAARDLCAFLSDPDRIKRARAGARRLADSTFSRDYLYSQVEAVLKGAAANAYQPTEKWKISNEV